MAASERSMRARVTHALRALDAMAVENMVQPGTPDVEFIGGWVELKSADRWPVREKTPLRVPHFNALQRLWLRRRWERGGAAWLLLRVKRDWLLLDGDVAARIVGEANREQLIAAARCYWPTTPSDDELLFAFTQNRR